MREFAPPRQLNRYVLILYSLEREPMKKYLLLSLILISLTCIVRNGSAEDAPEKLAQKAAEAWMPLWDSGKYDESYDQLAEHTRKNIPKRQWFVYWTAVRKPLGKLKSRKLTHAEYIKSLKGVSDQAGAILEYESAFENRASVKETFGMMRENNGTWRVANYIVPD
jgi:hypothetical protein